MANRRLTTQKVTIQNGNKSASARIPTIVGAKTKAGRKFNSRASSIGINYLEGRTGGTPSKRSIAGKVGSAVNAVASAASKMSKSAGRAGKVAGKAASKVAKKVKK